jgi:hypothetical protein
MALAGQLSAVRSPTFTIVDKCPIEKAGGGPKSRPPLAVEPNYLLYQLPPTQPPDAADVVVGVHVLLTVPVSERVMLKVLVLVDVVVTV